MFTGPAAGAVSDKVAHLVMGGLADMTRYPRHLSLLLVGWVSLLGAGLIACQVLKARPGPGSESEPAVERPAQAGGRQTRTDRYGDPLPAGALARLGTTRLRHTEQVGHVVVAPDGKTVASGGLDDTVRLWDAATGKLVRSLTFPGALWPRPVSFARDGKTLLAATTNQLWLVDVRTGEQLRQVRLKFRQNQRLLAISPDGKTAASGGEDGVIRLWDAATGEHLRALHGPGKSVPFISISPDNRTLASVAEGDDKVVRLWDMASGKQLRRLEHPRAVLAVSFAPDGMTLASGGGATMQDWPQRKPNPSGVRLWDVATGKLLRTLEGHQQLIVSVAFSADGRMLASGSWDGTTRLWDVTAGKESRKLNGPPACSLSFAPDGKLLALGSVGPAVRLWDVTAGQDVSHPGEAHTGHVCSVSFSPDGLTLATGASSGDGAARTWDAASGKPLRRLPHPGGAHSVAFAPDGKTLASGGAGLVCIWDAATGRLRHKLEAPGGSPLAFSPDGKLLVAGSDGGVSPMDQRTLRLWDVATGKLLRTLEYPHLPMSVAFSPDGKTLAVGTWGATIHLWDAGTGAEVLKLDKFPQHWGEIVALAFSPDGRTLAAGCYDRNIHLLEAATGKELRTLTGHAHQVLAVAFSPSGRLLASGSIDQTVRLWEVSAGLASECNRFHGHAAWVTAVAFSPDGRRLASASQDSTALVWDVAGLAGGKAHSAPRLTDPELTAHWRALASTDAAQGYQAVRALAATPDQAVPFLAGRLLLKRPDPRQVARLLADLDSEDFQVRTEASRGLAKLGEAVEPSLRQALKGDPSLEVRRRIERLLADIEPAHPEGASPRLLRWLRAVEVLEWIGSPDARELLRKWAEVPPRGEVGREARAALQRLAARP
jgi:WD40 repeat protein